MLGCVNYQIAESSPTSFYNISAHVIQNFKIPKDKMKDSNLFLELFFNLHEFSRKICQM